MTTKVHVVNFGPDVVEATTTTGLKQEIYQQQSKDFYVWDRQELFIREIKALEKPLDKIPSS